MFGFNVDNFLGPEQLYWYLFSWHATMLRGSTYFEGAFCLPRKTLSHILFFLKFFVCVTFRLGIWNVWAVIRLGYRMFGMWDVLDVECLDVEYLGCGMFEIWNVRDVEHVLNFGCFECGLFKMWDVANVECLRCGMLVIWDVWDVGYGMKDFCWDLWFWLRICCF